MDERTNDAFVQDDEGNNDDGIAYADLEFINVAPSKRATAQGSRSTSTSVEYAVASRRAPLASTNLTSSSLRPVEQKTFTPRSRADV